MLQLHPTEPLLKNLGSNPRNIRGKEGKVDVAYKEM